jgi:hypothetical protein
MAFAALVIANRIIKNKNYLNSLIISVKFPLLYRVKDVTQHQLVAVAERYLVEPPLTGRTLIGPVQVGLEDRGWTVLRQ